MKISDVIGSAPKKVYTVTQTNTIADTVDLLAEYGIGAVVVTSDGSTIEGIISERDVVRYLAHEQEGTLRIKVEDLMTHNVTTCNLGDDISAAMKTMIDGHFRHMPVMHEGAIHGLVSLADLAGAHLG